MEGNDSTRYYRVEVIAKLFDVTVRRVQQLTQDGVLQTTEIMNGTKKERRYDIIPTVQRYIKYLSDKAYNRSKSEKIVELQEQKLKAEIALKESQAELHQLKTAIASGEYISVDEAKLDYEKFFMVFKKFAMSLPARIGGMLSGSMDPVEVRRLEKDLSKDVGDVLKSFVTCAGKAAGAVNV